MSHRPFGCLFERPDREGWYIKFTWQGHSYRRYGALKWGAARKKLTATQALLESGLSVPSVLGEVFGDLTGSKLTFRKAAALYLAFAANRKRSSTLIGDTRRLNAICKATWTDEHLGRIRPEAILRWVEERQRTREVVRKRPRRPGETVAEYRRATDKMEKQEIAGASGATLNRDLALCSALFRWARSAGYVDENVIRRVPRFPEGESDRGTYLTPEEARALVAFAPPALRPFLAAALSTARRRGALLALRWRDVNLERREVTFRAASDKAHRASVVFMTDDLYAVLAGLDRSRPRHDLDANDPVFRLPDGQPLDPWQLRKLWEPTIQRCAAIPLDKRATFRFHDLRHTAASLLVAAGVPLYDLMRLGGWSTYSQVMRYSHFAPESGRKAVNVLGRVLALGNVAGLVETPATSTGAAPAASA